METENLISTLFEAWANEHDKRIFDSGDRAAYRRWIGDLDYMKQLRNAGKYEDLTRIVQKAAETAYL
jgi:hypothetical protein